MHIVHMRTIYNCNAVIYILLSKVYESYNRNKTYVESARPGGNAVRARSFIISEKRDEVALWPHKRQKMFKVICAQEGEMLKGNGFRENNTKKT